MADREILDKFGRALAYPHAGLPKELESLEELLEDVAARAQLDMFQRKATPMRLDMLEEQYTRAFDLAPQAVPYLSVHLFGPESSQRGQFMAALNAAYAKCGFDAQGELPDHVAAVLRYATVAPEGEWEELCQWCLPAPLRNMRLALEKTDNLYQHVIAAVELYVASPLVGEPSHV